MSFTALLLHPLYWPKWIRRLGIVLFPLAVPAWLALIVLAFLLTSFGPLGEIFDKAWNGRQRRPFRYEGYSYYGSMPPTRRIVLVPSPEPDPERLDAAE